MGRVLGFIGLIILFLMGLAKIGYIPIDEVATPPRVTHEEDDNDRKRQEPGEHGPGMMSAPGREQDAAMHMMNDMM